MLSIIIPQYNNSRMTEECIDSVINNTLVEYEIVLVDNGSVDQISDTYKSKVTYIRTDVNLLFAGGCNLGASKAKHPILCFLNNDTLLTSGWDDCVSYLNENPSIGIVGPKLIYPNNTIQHAGVQVLGTSLNGNIFDHRYRHASPSYPPANQIREYQCLTGACFFLRASDFNLVGGFDTSYHNGYEDNDLCFKIRFNLNKKVVYYPMSTVIHKESVTSSTVPYQESPNKKLFFERWGDKLIEDRSKFDNQDNGNDTKIIAIYKACDKEMKRESFKDERPEWFNKKNCFTSFYNSAQKSPIKIDIYVVFDGDPDGDLCKFLKSHDVTFIHVDIKSMYKANQYCYQMAKSMDFDYCYFVEDDYLHLENGISVLVDGLKDLGGHVFTLYDHPDRYTRNDDITKDMESVFVTKSSHWRTGESTTHTFALSKSTLMNNMDVFNNEAFFTNDRNLYRELYLKKQIRLVSAVPGQSSHVNKYFLSPLTDWEKTNAGQELVGKSVNIKKLNHISVITPTAYDFRYSYESIKNYYDIADEIFIGIDKDRISWAGNKFDFDMAEFQSFINDIDTDKKIKIIQENFHQHPIPVQNDTAEKNHLSSLCKNGNWILQIESDEYMFNKEEFMKWLPNADPNYGIKAQWVTVYKSFGDKILVANDSGGQVAVGTKLKSQYYQCRDVRQEAHMSPLKLLHYSWGRTRHELSTKFKNWGHAGSFDAEKYLDMWDKITLDNYMNFKDLHPIDPHGWPNLILFNKKDFLK